MCLKIGDVADISWQLLELAKPVYKDRYFLGWRYQHDYIGMSSGEPTMGGEHVIPFTNIVVKVIDKDRELQKCRVLIVSTNHISK